MLVDGGFHSQAVSRAYYAAFYAAAEALLVLGETRSKHSGVVAAFARLVVKPGGIDEDVGRALRSLFDQRNVADDGDERISSEQAKTALQTASDVVAAVERWFAEHGTRKT